MRNTCRARVASSCPNSTHAGDIEDALMRRAVSRPRIQLEPLHLECTTMLPVFEKREVVTGLRHPWFVYHKQSVLVVYCSSWNPNELTDSVCYSSGLILLMSGPSLLRRRKRRRRLLLGQGSILLNLTLLQWTFWCRFEKTGREV